MAGHNSKVFEICFKACTIWRLNTKMHANTSLIVSFFSSFSYCRSLRNLRWRGLLLHHSLPSAIMGKQLKKQNFYTVAICMTKNRPAFLWKELCIQQSTIVHVQKTLSACFKSMSINLLKKKNSMILTKLLSFFTFKRRFSLVCFCAQLKHYLYILSFVILHLSFYSNKNFQNSLYTSI